MVTTRVPWAGGNPRYTALFEAEVIGWLMEASVKAVSKRMRLSWSTADGISSGRWPGDWRAAAHPSAPQMKAG